MEMVIISKEDLQAMLDQAADYAVERAVFSLLKDNPNNKLKGKKKVKVDSENAPIDVDSEIDNWVPLHEGWELLKIKKGMWYNKFRFIITHKPYGRKGIWIYKPSIAEFFAKDNINRNKRT